jgi:2-C-methyl-D-erythritol 4-phosphate cytidylyltransferase
MKKYAIIVAGGRGLRMNSDIPKQFIALDGKPMLMHTLEQFAADDISIILVLPIDYHDYWKKLCEEHSFQVAHQIANGAEERFHSVKNGLKLITENDCIVAVHDAVRPYASKELITRVFEMAAEKGNAVAAIPSRDSVRRLQGGISTALPRNEIYLVQTPQAFQISQLRKAYQQEFRNEFTDDASVVERAGFPIQLCEGEAGNIKITFPTDLK